tara:strand:+ start:396 stop:632 length:237 start_codon:yes stop_codon:yes gene_type:complete
LKLTQLLISLALIAALNGCSWARYNAETKEGFFISFKDYNRFVLVVSPETGAITVIADQVRNQTFKTLSDVLVKGAVP